MTRSVFWRPLKVLSGLLTLAMVVGFGLGSASAATTSTFTKSTWRLAMAHVAVPKKGCFTGSYPSLAWHQVRCHTAPDIPYFPNQATAERTATKGPVRDEIGNGYDYSAVVSGSISSTTGSFPYISAGSTETGQQNGTGGQVANTYSLQLNTEFFTGSAACDGALEPADCAAWQQFLYSSTYKQVFMQYWLIDYDADCPSGWNSYEDEEGDIDCYTNSNATDLSANPTVAQLESVSLTGTAVSGGNDAVTLGYNGHTASTSYPDTTVDLAGNWTTSEFALVGDGDGTEANFSSGTTLDVKTAVNSGVKTAPTCKEEGFTGETNNLSFAGAPTLKAGSEPAVETQQTSKGGAAGCAKAGTEPNTVTVTNPGKRTSTVGAKVSLQLKGTDSAKGQTLKWSASGLPSGLSISSAGKITGKPKKKGTSTVTVTAKDTTGAKGTAKFTWVVKA